LKAQKVITQYFKMGEVCLLFALLLFTISANSQTTRTSIATGLWNTPGNWDCGCVPNPLDHAIIDSGDVITLNGNTTIDDLTIRPTATLIDNNNTLTINGNLVLDGTLDKRKTVMLAGGSGSTISGFGTTTNMGGVTISNGDKTILAGSDLSFTKGRLTINGGITLTNNGTLTQKANIIGNAGTTWINGANATLNAGRALLNTGTLIASAVGNTVNYYRNGVQVIKLPSGSSYYNLQLSGNNVKTLEGNTIILGDLTINSTLDVTTSDFSINLSGDWINAGGAFIEQLGTVTFDGSGNQTITNTFPERFFNMTVDKAGGMLTLTTNDNVSGNLSMPGGNAGTIDATSASLTLGTSCASEGTLIYGAGSIIGQFVRWIGNTSSFEFPVGITGTGRPALMTINVLDNCGTVIAEFVESIPGMNGMPIGEAPLSPVDSIHNTFVEGYWSLMAATGFISSNYNLECTGTGFASFPIISDTRLVMRPGVAKAWSLMEGSHVGAGNSTAIRNSISTLPMHYAFGDTTDCVAPITPAIIGKNSVCSGETLITYSVPSASSSLYTWTITGGAPIPPLTDSSITVNWGATGMIGNVRVVENNGCTNGAPVDLPVTIHTIAPTIITGKANVAESTLGEPYSVIATPGYTYNWTITGGTQNPSPDTDNSINVDWGSAGPGNVRVVADSGNCASATPVDLPVNIYLVIVSNGIGDWSNPSTWLCNCVPGDFDNVRILAGHTVTLTGNEKIANLVIDGGSPPGIIFDNGKRMDVFGDLTVNGTYTGTNRLTIKGTGNTIDGIGLISTSGVLRFNQGNTIIASSAILTKSPGNVELRGGQLVTNNGHITIAGSIISNNAAAIWTNAANSKLSIGDALLLPPATEGTLVATASNNTVDYVGAGGQTVNPVDYYHVSSTGISTSTLTRNTIVQGDFKIGASSTFNAVGFTVNVRGDWINEGGTYNGGSNTVIFDGTGTQTINTMSAEIFHSLTIASGSTVQTTGASDILGVAGDWTNNGTFNAQTGLVNFNGANAQRIGGSSPTTFHDITLTNTSGGVSLNTATNLTGTLTLTSGIFNTGGQDFTLISTSSGTANIAEITGGDITGTIIMQRFIAAGATGYHFMAAPVSGISLNDWDQEMVLSIPDGNNGCAGSSCWHSLKFYDETMPGLSSVGYDSLSSVGNGINAGQGYWVYTGTGLSSSTAYTMDSRGPANKNFGGITVTHTVSGGDSEDGWNLIGNPYPSDVNWNLVSLSGTLTPFGYIWDPNGGGHVSFDQNAGFILGSHQAIWVKVAEGGSGTHNETVTFGENSKTADGNNFLKTSGNLNPHLQINLVGAGYDMSTEVRFNQDATDAYDWQHDAYHLNSLVGDAPNLSTVTTSGAPTDLSINSVQDLSQNVSIPIRISWTKAGGSDTYTLSVDMESIPASSCVLLEDLWPPYTVTDLRQDSSITFSMVQAKNMPAHFMLHIGAQAISTAQSISCNGANNGYAICIGQGTGPWVYTWLDQAGDTVSGPNTVNGPDDIENLATGTYTVYTTAANAICQSAFEEFTIEEPQLLTAVATQENVNCFGETNGNIYLTLSGGTPPFTYLWSNGGNLKDNLSISAGSYSVTATDANNCIYTNSFTVTEPLEQVAISDIEDISCIGNNDGSIDLSVSGGSPPYNFIWNNGATSEDISNLAAGTYSIQISDNNNCLIIENGLIVNEGLSITAGFGSGATGVPGELQFTNLSIGGLSYFWDFGDGENSTTEHPIHQFSAKGNYSVSLNVTNGSCSDSRLDVVSVADSPVGIGENKLNEQIQVYMSRDQVILEFNYLLSYVISIELYNVLGQKISEIGSFSVQNGTKTLDLSKDAEGIYFVKVIHQSGEESSFKIIR